MDAALLERALHPAEVGEGAAEDELPLSFLPLALPHLVEPMVDERELELVGVDARRGEAEDTHLAEQEGDAPDAAEVPAVRLEGFADARDGARGVVRRRLDEDGDPVRGEALVEDLLVVDGVLAGGAPDRGLDAVLRHVDRAGVVHRAAKGRVALRVGAPPLDRDRDLLRDARELLRHPVPPGEHRDLALFEDPAHGYPGAARRARGATVPGRATPGDVPRQRRLRNAYIAKPIVVRPQRR